MNRSRLWPHAVSISDSMTDQSSSSKKYWSMDSQLELSTFLTLYLVTAADVQNEFFIPLCDQSVVALNLYIYICILMSPSLRVKRSKIDFGPAMLLLPFSFCNIFKPHNKMSVVIFMTPHASVKVHPQLWTPSCGWGGVVLALKAFYFLCQIKAKFANISSV